MKTPGEREDEQDIEDVLRVERDETDPPVSWEQVKRELGL